MNIRNCRRCGALFNVSITDKNVCPECIKKEEEDFEIARDYVKEHPGCSIKMVEEETGISQKLLLKFVREKKLEFADGSKPVLACEKCGMPIYSGRFCNGCLSKLGKAMMDKPADKRKAIANAEDQQNKGMHYSRNK